jgi:hypothetical protein
MFDVVRTVLGTLLLAVMTLTPGQAEARQPQGAQAQTQERPVIRRPIPQETRTGALPFARTELYFGTAMPDGVVSEADFQDFIDREVTPRFPDGLTVVKADGQFRLEDGAIIKEQSFVLVLFYPYESFASGNRRIERIRELYKYEFTQQSVLRVDDPFIVWVSF